MRIGGLPRMAPALPAAWLNPGRQPRYASAETVMEPLE